MVNNKNLSESVKLFNNSTTTKMDNVLRCSIIFVMLQIFCNHSGLASINPITNTNNNKVMREGNRLESIYSNERGDWDLPRLKSRNPPANIGTYDFEDYNHGGEELDNSFQYTDENTQNMEDDFDDNDYIEDESLMTADKRSRHVHRPNKKRTDKFVDLCPVRDEHYVIKKEWKLRDFKLRFAYKEIACNHTTTHDAYERQYNRICYSLGRTFEYGRGTHCFQRFIRRDIEVESIHDSKKRDVYTETDFRQGCTCGWATDELGSIHDYHYDKILTLCSELSDRT